MAVPVERALMGIRGTGPDEAAHMKTSAGERKCEQIQALCPMWFVSEVMLQSVPSVPRRKKRY